MAFVTFLDAMLHPHQHSQLGTNDTWDWDRDTLVKAQGMMAAYLCGQMEGLFRGETHHTRCLFSLVPSILVTTSVNPDNILDNLLKWEIDLPFPRSLPSEVRRWEGLWKTQKLNGNKEQTIPNNLLQALGACDSDSFPNIHHLLLIGCTLPISSAEAERFFSLMKRIKTCTRSIMTEQRLSDLAVIAIHYGERIPVDEACKAFIQANPRRMFQASLFLD